MRFHIKFSYDGSKYFGYQKQPRKKTVQSELQKALKKINDNKRVYVFASGRTDAGVHALNQHAHFDMKINIKSENLCRALNSLLPGDIYIKEVKEVEENFHARFDVIKKEYIYIINIGEYNPIEKDYVYQYNKNLDLDSMKDALKYIKGEHNFKSFVKSEAKDIDYIRTILDSSITKTDDKIIISLIGTGFMRYMVRNIVGTLIDIGEGKFESSYMEKILKYEDRKKAGKCAPACGLYLKDVYY